MAPEVADGAIERRIEELVGRRKND